MSALEEARDNLAYERYMENKYAKEKHMAQKVLILGDSGTGKSASLRNFAPEEVFVINTAGKPLPFKNHFETYTPSFNRLTADVLKAMDSTKKKVIVIDDAQYIMSFQYMRRIKENGWDKWNDIQGDFFNIVEHSKELPEDVVVYFLSHLQRDDEGHEKIKTMGKMLDEKITIEGLFTIVLKTVVKDGQYFFVTQNSGLDTVKSPIGMFPSYAIDNDLKYVDTKIRNYYEIGEYANDEEVAQMDQEVEKTEISKPDPSSRRSRRKKDTEPEKTIEAETSGTADGQGTVSESAPSNETNRRRKPRSPEEVIVKVETATKEPEVETPEKSIAEVDKGTGAIVGEAPRRRRRKANTITAEDVQNVEFPSDDDLPF